MDDDEEDFVFFGTPLPEIEDEAVLRKKAAKELQVRDEKGRQRFHGAFTGGFSAGYFNSVGTKEGWAPSTFVSSRSKISDRIQQNPEDFMDEEDFGEFGIATRKIQTTSSFQDTSDTNIRKRKYVDTDSVIPGEAPLKDIVQPVRESIGILILKKLGWRHGQGIGPRVKKKSSGVKTYGCSPFPDSATSDQLEEENDDPMSAAFTFAPKDTEGISYKPKDNSFGLGYTGLSKQSVLQASFDPFAPTSTKSWLAKDKKKLTISGQAFGVGAFEDDDEDIYGKDDMSQYDFSDLNLPGSKEDHQKAIGSSKNSNSQEIIEGFCSASQPPLVKTHYPPPVLPQNFRPIHLKSISSAALNTNLHKSRHALSASDRSLILGEKKFIKSSFVEVPISVEDSKVPTTENFLSSSTSTSSNFRPFPNDPAKQSRYEEYLKLKKTGDVHKLVQPSSMTEWEKQQEVEEFAKSSILFKPLSNVLSSRFQTGTHLSVVNDVEYALDKLKNKGEKSAPIKRNLIGTSNRSTFEWHPAPLLCKRMNVPNPYPDSSSSGTQNMFKGKSVFGHLSFTEDNIKTREKVDFPEPSASTSKENKGQEITKTEAAANSSINVKQVSVSSTSTRDIENFPSKEERPPMDFFKDIFENSSSDEGDTEEKTSTANEQTSSEKEALNSINSDGNNQTDARLPPKSINTEIKGGIQENSLNNLKSNNSSMSNKKVGFGVFANLDLDALNQRKPVEKSSQQNVLKHKNVVTEIDLVSDDDTAKEPTATDDIYGPELPPNFSNSPLPTSSSVITSSRKHSKRKSKHKHHKHKSKKKKKSSKKESSPSDSSDELEDIPPSLIIEKMKKLQKKL